MKKFFKIVFIIVVCVGIFIISGIQMKHIGSNVNAEEYRKLLANKNSNTTNNETSLEEVYNQENTVEDDDSIVLLNVDNPIRTNRQMNDWRLILVNFEHTLPENFKIKLANVDKSRQFDSRAIDELNALLKDAKKAKVGNLWVQSAYRSVERQEELFNTKIEEYKKIGKTQEEAEALTRQYINESNTSEHNLGLAVDFNYINNDFEKSKAFEWLCENAETYGFILRYRADKEEITRVAYEPWHWRYVGVEHAQKMNELDMCLEEYVEFLEDNN